MLGDSAQTRTAKSLHPGNCVKLSVYLTKIDIVLWVPCDMGRYPSYLPIASS